MRKHDGGLPTCCHAPAQGAQALTRMGAGMDGGGASAMGLTSAKRLSAVTGTGDAKLGLGRPKGLKPASVALVPLPAAACRMLAKERRQQVCSLQADVRARMACSKRIKSASKPLQGMQMPWT